MTHEPEKTEAAGNSQTDTSTGAVVARLGPAAVLALLWTLLPLILGLTLIVRYREPAADWLREQGTAGAVIYVGIFAVTAGLGLLPTWVQALIGGYAFGLAIGSPAAVAGFTLAAVIGFGVAKLIARDRVEDEIERHPKSKAVRDALVGKSLWRTLGLVVLIRLPPNSPFAITNLVLTSVKTPLWVYTVGTAVGMAPRTVIAVWLGSQVSDWDELNKPKWLVYGGIGLTVVVLMLLGQVANKAIEKVTQPSDGDSENPALE